MARRHLVNERNREELDEVSNKRLTSMAYDIAKGLEYLAEQKYVHRDIACRSVILYLYLLISSTQSFASTLQSLLLGVLLTILCHKTSLHPGTA